jgi:hypothetical protein
MKYPILAHNLKRRDILVERYINRVNERNYDIKLFLETRKYGLGLTYWRQFLMAEFCKKGKKYCVRITENLLKDSFKTNFPRQNLRNEAYLSSGGCVEQHNT